MNKPTTEIQFKLFHRETTANRQTAQTLKKIPQMSKMDKVNRIDIEFIIKKWGHSPETNKLRSERNKFP